MNEEKILSLPLTKKNALEILQGKKVREYRAFNDHWAQRLCTFDDPTDKFMATGIKHFDRVHFYPYNNKWYLDCEVQAVIMGTVDEDFLKEYGDEVQAEIGSDLFVIRLGKVIDTNLEI